MPTLGLAVLLLSGLALLATSPAPAVPLALAADHEGAGPVQLTGTAQDVGHDAQGRVRLSLEQDGAAIAVRGPAASVVAGQQVVATGRLVRFAGVLTLLVGSPAELTATDPGGAPAPSWRQVAQDPAAWSAQAFWLTGTADATSLRDGDGHRVQLGAAPPGTDWPRGPVRVLGMLRQDAGCLCHRLDALQVQPWTS